MATQPSKTFAPKLPDEIVGLDVSFEGDIPSGCPITAVTCAIAVFTGTDPDVANMIAVSCTNTDTRVFQDVQGGVAGVTYILTFTVTFTARLDDSHVVEEQWLLPVVQYR